MNNALTLEAARRVAVRARCAPCGGNLIIDHDADRYGHGNLHCLACGHVAATVQVVEPEYRDLAEAKS